jgi:hypothetical protein
MFCMATDFRDGTTFPRRGRELLGGALWLARISDKAHASAAGTIHDYIYPCPMDRGVMQRWGITPEEFDEAVRAHGTDDDLWRWFASRVSPAARAKANRWLEEEQAENLNRQDAEEGFGGVQ